MRPTRPDPPPVRVDVARVLRWGTYAWAAGLLVVLAVPSLREGTRDYWPWVCVAGVAIGALGEFYVRRGQGNAGAAYAEDQRPPNPPRRLRQDG